MATKKTARQKTTVERELEEVKEELRQEKKSGQALELDNNGLKVRVAALNKQLDETERQAAKLEGELSAATSQLNWEREESQREKAKLEGEIEGMDRTMKILRRWGQPKRRRNR